MNCSKRIERDFNKMGEPSKRTENDIIRLSQAMDSLAKLIISKRKDGSQLQVEYNLSLIHI